MLDLPTGSQNQFVVIMKASKIDEYLTEHTRKDFGKIVFSSFRPKLATGVRFRTQACYWSKIGTDAPIYWDISVWMGNIYESL